MKLSTYVSYGRVGKNNKPKIQYYPRQALLPEGLKPGIDYNIIEHRPLYILDESW